MLPSGVGERWAYGFEWSPATEALADYDSERLRRRITRSAGVEGLPVEIERVASFSFAAQIADQLPRRQRLPRRRCGSPHQSRGGTGMNTAIADGFDLGWKLAWVLDGWAPASLLDSYEGERRPIVEHNLARSAEEDGSRRGTLDEVHVDLRGRIAHRWLEAPHGRRSSVDLVGPGVTVFAGPDWSGDLQLAGIRPAVEVHTVDEVTARGMGIAAEGSLAVRPDGVPVAASPAAAWRSPRAGSGWSPRRSA